MKERPILFSATMVRAILEGRKTQTRRVVKGIALDWLAPNGFTPEFTALPENELCPYGQPGDRLWVRETFTLTQYDKPVYRADCRDADGQIWHSVKADPDGVIWKPSIHMPRWASRITLEIVSVRVERLNEISEQDAIAEGIETLRHGFRDYLNGDGVVAVEPRISFCTLWESINGAGSWQQDPWVWVIEFKQIKE